MVRTSFQACLALAWVALAPGGVVLHAQTVLWNYTSYVGDLDHMGDFDGDGVPDVVVADGPWTAVAALVLSGVDGSVIHTFGGSDVAPACVAGGGDFDGDGKLDVLVGYPGYTDIHGNAVGRVVLISGKGGTLFSSNGYSGSYGTIAGVGVCVRGMGDVDGDGKSDFTFGEWTVAPPAWPLGPSEVVEILKGSVDVDRNSRFDDSLGRATDLVTPLEDLDGDGWSDFATSYVDVASGLGTVAIFSGKYRVLLRTIVGADKDEHFGISLGSCGDVDGDGLRDLLVGAPYRKSGGIDAGAVVVYSSATGSFRYEVDGDTSGQRFGIGMDGLDDVDGDGVADFVVGSDGNSPRLGIFSAAAGNELFRLENTTAWRVRDVGDLDGDGHDDLAWCDGTTATAFSFRPYLALDSVAPDRYRWDQTGTLDLAGTGFTADPNLAVLFDGAPATNIVVRDYTSLQCTPPALPPGPHDVTVTNRFGSATLAGGLLVTPAMFVDGDALLGATITLRYEFDANDSTLAIAGAPPVQSIPTPPFGNALAISSFIPLFFVKKWPTDEYTFPATIPNDPALVGVTALLQALTGSKLSGPGKSGAWTNCVEITIQ